MASLVRNTVGAICAASLAGCHPAQPTEAVTTTYAANRCGGMPANWHAPGDEYGDPAVPPYLLRIDPYGFQWNSVATDESALRKYLGDMAEMQPPPPLTVMFDRGTNCVIVAEVRRMIETRVPCTDAVICVEYSYDEWKLSNSKR